MGVRSFALSLLIAVAAGTAASAEDASPIPPVQNSTPPLACLHAGTSYGVGEFACIAACHQQRRLARCDAVMDKASWTYVSEACPSAAINPPWPSTWSEAPVSTAMSPIPVTVTSSAMAPDLPVIFAKYGLVRSG